MDFNLIANTEEESVKVYLRCVIMKKEQLSCI